MTRGKAIEDIRESTWRLIRIEDPTRRLRATPTGYQLLTFRPSTLFDTDGNATPVVGVSTGGGTSTIVEVHNDGMIFGEWINNMVVWFRPRPQSSPDPARLPLSLQELKFLWRVLSGEVSWRAIEDALSISNPNVGSLDFVADVDARM